jgi:CheY-like chemotaxis protein
LETARKHLADGAPGLAGPSASQASSLAGLPFLPVHDGEWVDGVRQELAKIRSRALEIEARAYAATGDIAAASAAAERLVATDPFNEGAHQLRIKILGQAGDRSGAIRAFENCRALLEAELGVEPSDETKSVLRAATSSSVAPAAPQQVDGLSVLVVEDHDFQRRTAVMLLRKLGIDAVTEASDGAAALELLQDSAGPDVVLCDIDMPGMDGVEFIRHVAERELAGAVIIASALDAKLVQAVRSVSEGYGLQVLGAVVKPLTARVLTDLLATYQRRPRSRPSPTRSASSISVADARAALAAGQLAVHLQPGIDAGTGLVTSADAVPRWNSPSAGWLPPDLFRPVLERAGLMAELAAMALEASWAAIVSCAAEGFDLEVTAQLAPESLDDTALADRAAHSARGHGADARRMTFALDERALRNARRPRPAARQGLRRGDRQLRIQHRSGRTASPVSRHPSAARTRTRRHGP